MHTPGAGAPHQLWSRGDECERAAPLQLMVSEDGRGRMCPTHPARVNRGMMGMCVSRRGGGQRRQQSRAVGRRRRAAWPWPLALARRGIDRSPLLPQRSSDPPESHLAAWTPGEPPLAAPAACSVMFLTRSEYDRGVNTFRRAGDAGSAGKRGRSREQSCLQASAAAVRAADTPQWPMPRRRGPGRPASHCRCPPPPPAAAARCFDRRLRVAALAAAPRGGCSK